MPLFCRRIVSSVSTTVVEKRYIHQRGGDRIPIPNLKKIEIACDGYSLQEKRCLTLLGASNCFRVNPFQIKIDSESIPVS